MVTSSKDNKKLALAVIRKLRYHKAYTGIDEVNADLDFLKNLIEDM